jgi:hypothetical protein
MQILESVVTDIRSRWKALKNHAGTNKITSFPYPRSLPHSSTFHTQPLAPTRITSLTHGSAGGLGRRREHSILYSTIRWDSLHTAGEWSARHVLLDATQFTRADGSSSFLEDRRRGRCTVSLFLSQPLLEWPLLSWSRRALLARVHLILLSLQADVEARCPACLCCFLVIAFYGARTAPRVCGPARASQPAPT